MYGCSSRLLVSHGGLSSLVRCGNCVYCRIRKKQSWVGRLLLERSSHLHASFLTLTYGDAPEVLDYRDFQLFLKRFRHEVGSFRYFAVGEYGEKSGRAHWHAIIFGVELGDGFVNLKSWDLGFVFAGTVNAASIGYVAGYTMKWQDRTKRPITRMSRNPGIGLDQIERFGAECARAVLSSWPTHIGVSGKNYPVCDTALEKFKKGYLEAGGSVFRELSPEERSVYSRLEYMGDPLTNKRRPPRRQTIVRSTDGL